VSCQDNSDGNNETNGHSNGKDLPHPVPKNSVGMFLGRCSICVSIVLEMCTVRIAVSIPIRGISVDIITQAWRKAGVAQMVLVFSQ
jgi:hypothetical protein